MSLNCVHAGGKPVRDLTHEDTFFVTIVFISSVQFNCVDQTNYNCEELELIIVLLL